MRFLQWSNAAWALCWAQQASPFFRSLRQKKMWRLKYEGVLAELIAQF
jgi:hypothetical protein